MSQFFRNSWGKPRNPAAEHSVTADETLVAERRRGGVGKAAGYGMAGRSRAVLNRVHSRYNDACPGRCCERPWRGVRHVNRNAVVVIVRVALRALVCVTCEWV